mmetsp:Transcript_14796/g.35752  ORF Transcript_14796/g.35752 Transcript_14796/m.35752 type:complete len:210 (+) Transcript_14796:68-697(+)|eukprot:CAMPEP_0180137180 /NCGR_PEP_ID=MMETSP0986-20121125/12038_1 /TAXON_ID=697907 /ORGANISM="non described non described, Strain CCMP2293" /LENGTH=209 /DNA_ID=CAMNT_0022078551 /DNA_START=50 /DNA_END=679 /DNA_ORIENTATION=+
MNTQHLIDSGESENQKNDDLLEAAQAGDIEGVTRAMQIGAEIDKSLNANGCTPLHIAAHKNDAAVMQLLLQAKPNLESRSNFLKLTPLHTAVSSRSLECVKLLLEAGADFEAMNDSGERAIHLAIQRSEPDIIRALVIRGANRHVPAPCMWDSLAPKTPMEMAESLHPKLRRQIEKALQMEDQNDVWRSHNGMSFSGSVTVLRSASDDD